MKLYRDGFALILVIWALVLMSSLATGFSFAVRHEIRVAGDLAAIAHAEAASAAALHSAVLAISSADPEQRWIADGQVHELAWPDATVTLSVQATSGRIDLNKAPRPLLIGLLMQLFPDADHDALADAIVDWRDKDDRPEPNGAEDVEYERAGYAYVPPNRPFHSVNELSQVMGFDSRRIEALMPYLTVHGRSDRIHAATADLVTLASIPGIGRAEAEEFIERREIALAEHEALDMTPLRRGARFLDSRVDNKSYSLLIQVSLPDGLTRRERVELQLQRNGGFNVLARETLSTPTGTPGADL